MPREILRRRLHVAWVLGLCSALCAAGEDDAGPAFSAMRYLSHVQFLASDELAGRDVGSPGIDIAAEYIAERFEHFGLQPGGQDDSFFQYFDVPIGRQTSDQPRLEIEGITATPRADRDFVAFPCPSDETFEGPVAFVGYGISAPEFDYDDYAGFDAAGKVLLIFRYEPYDSDRDAEFGGQEHSRHAAFATKAELALQAGARAILIVNPPRRHGRGDRLAGHRTRLGMMLGGERISIPMMHVKRRLAERMLKAAGLPKLRTLQRTLDRQRRNLSADLPGIYARGQGNVIIEDAATSNVIGILPGEGELAEEVVIFGAHYDHLGMSAGPRPGLAGEDQFIHNGADDNASGTAAVIELARRFAAAQPTKRSLAFIAFSAEERGLLGSRHFVEQPTVTLEKIVAMLNMDMIGRQKKNRVHIYGGKAAEPLRRLLKTCGRSLGLRVYRHLDLWASIGGSDHAPFDQQGIPAVMFHTGVHMEYHRPADDWHLINAEGAVRVLDLVYCVGRQIANAPQRLPVADRAVPAARPAADKRPRLGIVAGPDSPAGEGLAIDHVLPGGPADQAGIRDTDRILRLGDADIHSFDDLLDALAAHQPGDNVQVVVLRDGQAVTLTVTLGG